MRNVTSAEGAKGAEGYGTFAPFLVVNFSCLVDIDSFVALQCCNKHFPPIQKLPTG